MSIQIIAEAGVNHNGDIELARRLIDIAADAGADVVKFQTFRADEVVAATAPKAVYQSRLTNEGETHHTMLHRLELSEEAHHELIDHCRCRGIVFLSTPFDLTSLDFLITGLQLDTLKIPSGEVTNAPLLLNAGRSGCAIILSTGMATLDEVAEALDVVAFGRTEPDAAPSRAAIRGARNTEAGRTALASRLTLLHCTTEYPAPFAEANLRAMITMAEAFGLPVGLSDHTPGVTAAVAAAAMGAVVIEKHFTLDRSLPGPDHQASLEPEELAALVEAVRTLEGALGDGVKAPMASEMKNIPIARKSLVARFAIRAGEPFTTGNLAIKRPGDGVSPMRYWDMIGTTAKRDYAADEKIEPGG